MAHKEFGRTQRIAPQIRRELAEILSRQVSDPRLERLVISVVEVSKDLSHAKVFFTLPNAEDAPAALAALKGASGYLRRQLADRLRMRALPTFRFVYDASLDSALRLSELIDTAVADDLHKGSSS
jgi:ribosome-binding factor A